MTKSELIEALAAKQVHLKADDVDMAVKTLLEQMSGALANGENGKAYLIGDENLSFADYFKLFFQAAGNDVDVPSLDQEHPMLPDGAIFTGRGNTVSYEPDAQTMADLGFRRNDIARAVNEVVAQFKGA